MMRVSPPELAVVSERNRLAAIRNVSEKLALLGLLVVVVGSFVMEWLLSGNAGGVSMAIGTLLILVAGLTERRFARRLEELDADALANAPPQPGRILESESSFLDGRPVLKLTVHVASPPHAAPATVTCPRDYRRERLAQPGSKVWLRVHPALPRRVEIDWDLTAQHAPAAPDIPQSLATVTLTCTSCGAKLQLHGRTSVTCQYCHTENHVVRS